MKLKKVAQLLIYIHAVFGGIVLISGTISLISKKGNQLHKKSGKLFAYSMLAVISLSFIIAVLPLFGLGLHRSFSGTFI